MAKVIKQSGAMARAKQKLDEMKKKNKKGGGGDGGEYPFDYMVTPEGKRVIRIFGPWNAETEEFYRELAYHRNVGEAKATVMCPKCVDAKAPCPICEVVEELRAKAKKFPRNSDKNKRYWDEAGELRAKPRFFLNAVWLDKGEPKYTTEAKLGEAAEKPEVLGAGSMIMEAVLGYYTDEDADTSGVFWKEGGRYDFILERTGTGKNDTEYSVKTTRKYADVDTSEIEANIHDLTELMGEPKSYAEIKSILTGEEIEDEGDTEEAEESEEEVEETEETEESDEEEVEEKPAKKAIKKPSKKVEEDDEEEPEEEAAEEEGEEDAEEEKPAKAAKKPVCFGEAEDYDAKDATCKACAFKAACIKEQAKRAEASDEEPEEAEETEDEPAEDDEEEAKAKVTKKKVIKKKVEEEEEAEAEEDEEEAEEEIETKMKAALKKKGKK
jgi:hypothetical protein